MAGGVTGLRGAVDMAISPKRSQTAQETSDLPFAANSQKFMLAAGRIQAQAFRAAMSFQLEVLEFLKHRCEMHVKLVDRLGESEEPNDAVNAVTAFMQDAATDYVEEANKVITLGSKIASETAKREEAA
jgi:hypothetical protein